MPRFGFGSCDRRHRLPFEYPIIFWTSSEVCEVPHTLPMAVGIRTAGARRGAMAPKPKPKLARFVFVFGMAVAIQGILTWLSRDLAAPPLPTESIYRAQSLILY